MLSLVSYNNMSMVHVCPSQAPAWEGRQEAVVALVSSGTTVPPSHSENSFPWFTSHSFLNSPSSPLTQWVGNQSTYQRVEDNTYVHPEVPSGILAQPLWQPPPPKLGTLRGVLLEGVL